MQKNKSNLSVKNRAMILVLSIMVIISLIFLYVGIFFQNKYFKYSLERDDLQLRRSFTESLDRIYIDYISKSSRLASDERVISAYLQEDRELLYKLMKPLYQDLRLSDPYLHVMHFHLPDNTTFLRMHNPSMYGDNLTQMRPMLADATRNVKTVRGFEAGKNGIYFRVISPIIYEQKMLGAIEFGIRVDFLTKSISDLLQFSSGVFVKKQYVPESYVDSENVVANDFVLISSTDDIFIDIVKDYQFETTVYSTMINGRHYALYSGMNLTDYRGDKLAKILIAQDVTSQIKEFREATINLGFIIFVLALLASVIMNYSFGSMIAAIQKGEQILARQHFTDSLTNLPNRNQLIKDIEDGENLTLLLINIDRFNDINESFGIDVGDFVLKSYADVLRKYLQEFNANRSNHECRCSLYRLGRDEFVILLHSVEEKSAELAKEISERTDNEIFNHGEVEVSFTITIGISNEQTRLLECADAAMKLSRKLKKQFVVYDPHFADNKNFSSNIELYNKVKGAIADDRIVPHFQPIVENVSGEVVKYECLIRMIDEDGKVVSPMRFLPFIKKTRLYPELTRIMIRKSVEKFKHRTEDYSINLSAEDILNRESLEFIKKIISENDCSNLIFEILESENIDSYSEVQDFIAEVKRHGCKIAIDDFGTGYSNFEHLLKLDIDYLKIDGSLIENLGKDSTSLSLIKTIVSFASEMNVQTVAEFVSEKEIYDKVKEIGINYSQGFYISAPKNRIEG